MKNELKQRTNVDQELIVPRHPHIYTLEQIKDGARSKVGGKAKNIAELSNQGFPVPRAVAVSTDAYKTYQASGRLDQSLVIELERIRAKLGGKVALRSSANCEDGVELSMAGVFETVYLQESTQTIGEALLRIYEQAQSDVVSNYLELHEKPVNEVMMGVVLQKLIEPDTSGVIYTGIDKSNTLIQYTSGFGDRLVDGITEGSSIVYSPDEAIVTNSKNTDISPMPLDTVRELDALASKIRHTFSGLPQDIEFAIQDGKIFVLQARTLTSEISDVNLEMSREDIVFHTKEHLFQIVSQEKAELGSESVVLSDSNFSELLPRPKEMDFGVFAYIFTGSDGMPGAIQLGRQQMGYPLGDESVGFMHYVGGKPYFSIARDAHTFYAGFPDTRHEYNSTLVAEYLEQIKQDPSKGEYPEMGLYLQDPTLEDLTMRYGEKGQEYFDIYLDFKRRMADHASIFMNQYLGEGKPEADQFIVGMEKKDLQQLSEQELIDYVSRVLEHLRTVSCVNFVKSARLGFYYSQRLQQMLGSDLHIGKDRADSTFAGLNQGLDGSEITLANLKIAQARSTEEAVEIGRQVVGHYSTGEMLEIRHPRLKDDESALRQYVEGIFSSKEQYLAEFNQQKKDRVRLQEELLSMLEGTNAQDEFYEVMTSAQTYMALRETVKYQFVKEYALLRDALVELAGRTQVGVHEVFSLYPREIAAFTDKPASFRATIIERQERFEKYPLLNLPPVIRESDIGSLGSENVENLFDTMELFGKLLAQGKALEEAIIVNIEDFNTVEAARDVLLFYRNRALPIVLVASQMNLSHDPLIMQADGLVIENAGLVSHGAQRARELGRGAIGGIRAKSLRTGEFVNFDPTLKKVTRSSNRLT